MRHHNVKKKQFLFLTSEKWNVYIVQVDGILLGSHPTTFVLVSNNLGQVTMTYLIQVLYIYGLFAPAYQACYAKNLFR